MEAPFDEATAYHEAGHAVIALSVGRPVHRVSVLPNRERLGVCEFRKAVFRPTKDWIEEEILISLGGIAAEARRTGNYAWEGAGRDLRYVRRLAIQRAGERQAERLERRHARQSRELAGRRGTLAGRRTDRRRIGAPRQRQRPGGSAFLRTVS